MLSSSLSAIFEIQINNSDHFSAASREIQIFSIKICKLFSTHPRGYSNEWSIFNTSMRGDLCQSKINSITIICIAITKLFANVEHENKLSVVRSHDKAIEWQVTRRSIEATAKISKQFFLTFYDEGGTFKF